MANLAENNLIRFISLIRKKEGIFASFKVKGIRSGVVFTASVVVDIAAAEVSPNDPLEKIIDDSARLAVDALRRAEFQFEGMTAI